MSVGAARVAVLGCGGLGVAAAWTLAAGGVRDLLLVDHDHVERSNLHRQVLYGDAEVGRRKVEALAAAISARFPACGVATLATRLDPSGVAAALAAVDAVVEGTDDAAMKFAVSDAAVARRVGVDRARGPSRLDAVVAAAIGRRGQWMLVGADGPCFRCLFAEPAPSLVASCRVAGVLGPVVGEVGALAARAMLRRLAGQGDAADAALVRLDRGQLRRFAVDVDPGCRCNSPVAATG